VLRGMALLGSGPFLTTNPAGNAESVEESRLLFVPREEFYSVLSDHVEIVAGLFKHLARRLRKLTIFVEKQTQQGRIS